MDLLVSAIEMTTFKEFEENVDNLCRRARMNPRAVVLAYGEGPEMSYVKDKAPKGKIQSIDGKDYDRYLSNAYANAFLDDQSAIFVAEECEWEWGGIKVACVELPPEIVFVSDSD
jgi:hypothetical protein